MRYVKTHTNRGFPLVEFRDSNDWECSLQCSSAAIGADGLESPGTSAIWLGLDKHRMHLSKDEVKHLISWLQKWLHDGDFGNQQDQKPNKQ